VRPVRHNSLAGAVPVEGRSHGRTPAFLRVIDRRDKLIRAAARFYPGSSDREVARRLRSALAVYAAGRWRRDRSKTTCPHQHRGKLTEVLYLLLRVRDHVPSDPTFRRALGSRDPARVVQSDI
jgi:hypothetical protein